MGKKQVKNPWGEFHGRLLSPEESVEPLKAMRDVVAPLYWPEKGWMQCGIPMTEQEAREWFLSRGMEFDPEPEKRYLNPPFEDDDDDEDDDEEDPAS